ncbi:amidohydrolase [Thermosipho melanesiensis]|uniref:Amidohydrolase n=2 Tax=Thermosipho melanesiensis TaxID=46541 RepID=A6LNA9_THEM4|nr:amidohydrolase [Thermosipho melanesiensis]ABR31410.1 amidohydrolase [Thermosipho melanesiensis BI429]APT74469.1 S-adenosylhomocysteine deaminase [Thermosipho melanesiensis]OOC36429.1 amidohydrolase [Thermosipho melanesiensis]OOC37247.1 amidohydrolase [Thermosipho melanesiensis]OOC37999.1 amidohydrolase [Thermosipho melanesiensis]
MILKNALVLKDWNSSVEKLDIEIEEKKIKKISKNLTGENYIDLSGKLIIPGLINTHTHVAMSIFRGIAEDLSFDDWLFKNILPLEEKLDKDIVYFSSLLSMMEMAKNGIVAFCDMYMYEYSVAKAAYDFGIKALVSRGLVSEGNKIEPSRLSEAIKLFEKWNNVDDRIYVALGPHAPYTCSIEALKEVGKLSKNMNIPVTIHLFENAWERERYSLKDILETNIADFHLLAVHCIHLNEREIEELKNYNVYISHNPTSNLKLGNGIAPLTKFIENNIPVALGTDGPASNNSLDILFEARLASLLQKKNDPKNVTTNQALKMLTENGYKALKLDGGIIKENLPADLTIIELNTPSYFPLENIKHHLIHSKTTVYATMVNGKFIYISGKFPTIDEKEVYKQFSIFYKKVLGIEN